MTVPFGLRLGATRNMSQNTGGNAGWQQIDPSNATAIYRGDPVTFNSGFLERAAAAGPFQGVFDGCRYVDSDGSIVYRSYWDGNSGRSDIQAYVLFAEDLLFLIRTDDSEGNVDQSFIGTRRNVILNAGSNLYGDSRVSLGSADVAGVCFVEGRHEISGNEFGQPGVILEVSVAKPLRTA